ncbi:RNA methyltransferase [Azoarcus indigens]|uniref:TrmH family RNA methyltransferase n=1 Tax=Azoarcus indigens TaxID=29545 RepID=A0A4R6DL15_9RHOO|nr:RNA methyltransferase [Azoarcus indigens]NMG67426.1 RNA methyltransferase [Azoarcus indigens]TDN45521.1 TrmH family RNA methyltransferase [Azoarcus indigens]
MKTISSRDNPTLKKLHGVASSARERRKHGLTLLDGPHLLAAALDAGWPLQAVYLAESAREAAEIADLLARLPAQLEPVRLPDALFAHISPVDAPSGILAAIALPGAAAPSRKPGSLLVLDGVQDPGNLGTLLRTAAAAGLSEVLLGEGCAQAWSPRALRAAMGAHFLLRICERCDLLAALQDYPGKVLATALVHGSRSLYEVPLDGPVAWLFGAEGQGLSPELLRRADATVLIPMAAGVESLNVAAAAAICLFEQRRQTNLG